MTQRWTKDYTIEMIALTLTIKAEKRLAVSHTWRISETENASDNSKDRRITDSFQFRFNFLNVWMFIINISNKLFVWESDWLRVSVQTAG